MTRDDYVNDFNASITPKLYNIVEKLHEKYERLNAIREIILENEDLYVMMGVELTKLKDINNFSRLMIDKATLNKFDVIDGSYLRSYNAVISAINTLKRQLTFLNKIKDMPLSIWVWLQESINHEIGNFIIRGNKYTFGNSNGSIKILHKDHPERARITINYHKTRLHKEWLMNHGFVVFTPAMTDGMRYMHYDEHYTTTWWQWGKRMSKIKNHKYYRFKTNYTKKETVDVLKDKSPSAILANHELAPGTRCVLYRRANPSIIAQYERNYIKPRINHYAGQSNIHKQPNTNRRNNI